MSGARSRLRTRLNTRAPASPPTPIIAHRLAGCSERRPNLLRSRRFRSLHTSQPRSVYRHFATRPVSHGRSSSVTSPRRAAAARSARTPRRAPALVELGDRRVDELGSNALSRGLTIFEVARIAGTSTKMIELHYGSFLDSARDSLLERLEAPEHMAAEAAEGGRR